MAIIIRPSVARLGIIETGLDPGAYPALDGVWGAHGVEYPNNGYSTTEPPSLINANIKYLTDTTAGDQNLGILLPISSDGTPTVVGVNNSLPQYRHPRWSRF